MARSAEDLQAQISESLASGFHGELLARGQARAMIWRDGELPEDAPAFSSLLSYDLLSYGYTLLNLSISLLEARGDAEVARKGFENAASAIESAIAKSDKTDNAWAFHMLMAASAYHMGRFSARAYSLISPMLKEANLSLAERCLALLMVRDLEGLNDEVLKWRRGEAGTDEAIMALFDTYDANPNEDTEIEDDPAVLDGLQLAITDNFVGAISTFLLALERGDNGLVDDALKLLSEGMSASGEINFVPLWWDHRVAKYLIGDLWDTSYHVKLPLAPADQTGTAEWSRLRYLLIALLLRRGKAEIELWPSQIKAAERAANLNDDLVVSLPTSAGKTRIAELAIMRCLSSGRRVVFVTPLRALSAQTEIILQKTFLPLGKSISTLYGSIGVSGVDQDALRVKDIVVATPEKLDFALRNDPSLLDDVGLIVLDEGHMIGLGEREVRYEAQIQRLLKRPDAASRRIVCLSAILPDGEQLEDFVNWLTKDHPGGAVKSDWRPTRLRFGEIVIDGPNWRLDLQVGDEKPWIKSFIEPFLPPKKKRKLLFPNDQRELCLAAAWKLVSEGQSVLIFCPERRSVEPFAKAIVDLAERGALVPVLAGDPALLATALQIGAEWLGQDSAILKCLELGVAIHHGALPTPYRKEVERLLREGILRVTVSSPTLAQGLNLAASTLIFFSVVRNKELIPIADFKNIIGRAGRAYVDVEGLILFPMFKDEAKQKANWKALCEDARGRGMESGLYRLVYTLIFRMYRALKEDGAALVQYVMNNANVWEFPIVANERAEFTELQRGQWGQYLTSLDTAILSLVGEEDIPVADLAARLDDILGSSLWARSLARQKNEVIRDLISNTLKRRATHIWSKSTAIGRKGYFLAGVGLDTGLELDAVAQVAAEHLIWANGAILAKDQQSAIQAFTALAEVIFEIGPFIPKELPANWKEVLKAWLLGEPLAAVAAGNETEVMQFVENGLIYRLPWGMEAIRVRGLAVNDFKDDNGFTLADFELGLAAQALETGTLNVSAAILIKAGFGSRLAAISAIQQTNADFDNASGFRKWLESDQVQKLSEQGDWPTAESAAMWQTFRESFGKSETKVWKQQTVHIDIAADQPYDIKPFQPLRLGPDSGTLLFDASYQKVGTLSKPVNPKRKGLLRVTSAAEFPSIQLDYFGPDDLIEDDFAAILG